MITVVYYEADWEGDELCWYQTIFQRVTTTDTLIVSLVRLASDASAAIERAGIFTSIQDERGQHWKLVRWVQPEEIVLIHSQT